MSNSDEKSEKELKSLEKKIDLLLKKQDLLSNDLNEMKKLKDE
jgi:hypothetical protein